MLVVALFVLLAASAAADDGHSEFSSFSPVVGSGSGDSFSLIGQGRITAIRVWEKPSSYITGLQLCFDSIWSGVAGSQSANPVEMKLFEGEAIIQVSGKVGHYVQWLVFTTNMGRSLYAGQPAANSFNMYAEHKEAELRLIRTQFERGITSIQTTWDVLTETSTRFRGGRAADRGFRGRGGHG